MNKYRCLKYDVPIKDPRRKRKCYLTHGNPKGCIWEEKVIKDTLINDPKKGIKIELLKCCKYLKETD